MNISDDDNIDRWQKSFPIIANPNHCTEKKHPRNRLGDTNLFKPFVDLLLAIFGEKILDELHNNYLKRPLNKVERKFKDYNMDTKTKYKHCFCELSKRSLYTLAILKLV